MAEYIQILEDAIKAVTPSFMQNGKAKELSKISETLEKAKTKNVGLIVCGEFKRGKSTFVNALIGRNICATDTDICTSVVSIIKYGEKETVTRVYGDFSNPKTQKISLDDLERYTVGTAEEIDNTIAVEISLPLPFLKAGLTIIDTPGVGGLDPRHASLTNYFIPQADVALFMTDVNEPMTTTELNYLKNRVLPFAKRTAIVVNKADLRDAAEVEDFRQDTIAKVAAHTQTPKENIIAVSVSSAAEAFPESDLGESNFSQLRSVIADLVTEYRRDVIKGISINFVELLNLTIAPIQAQLQQIEQPDVNQIDQLTKQKNDIDRRLAQIADPNSSFRVEINKEITAQREDIMMYLNEQSGILQSEVFPALIKSNEAKGSTGGQWVGQRLNDAIAEIGTELTIRLDRVFSSIAALPYFEGMLQFDTKEFSNHFIVRDLDTSVPINKRIMPMMGGISVATFGAMWLATGVLGVLASLGIGAYLAYKNQKDAAKQHTESELRQMYAAQLTGAVSNLNTYVNTRFTEFQQEWIRIISDRCKAYKESLNDSIANIQKVKQEINQAVNLKLQTQNKLKPLLAAKTAVTGIKW